MKIGYFRHWFQPSYTFVEFLKSEGCDVEQIDYSYKGYLEPYDIALVEQDGFDDYIENDSAYIQDWVARGGILLFMHQDWRRWAPFFLPQECGYTQLVHRHCVTITEANKLVSWNYMLPRVEHIGSRLFHEPNDIAPDEMLGWKVPTFEFGLVKNDPQTTPATVETTAISCFQVDSGWEILGSYRDPAVKNGALLLQRKVGKGLYFMCQMLFPEKSVPTDDPCLAFWRKFLPNLLAHLARFKAGDTDVPARIRKQLPLKRNYNLAIHMHSLDWFGCDSSLGTIEAIMRRWRIDICGLALKDTACYDYHLDLEDYSDDHALFLHGQEYHPFNWHDSHDNLSHNTYHILALGIDEDAYTPEYTRSLFSDEEVADYFRRAVAHIHQHHGVAIATHPDCDTWASHSCDGADMEPLRPLAGTMLERQWLAGHHFTLMNSVDLFGYKRMFANPAANFIYTGAVPTRDNVCAAVKAGHSIAACFFHGCDITLGGHLPGDTLPRSDAHAFQVKAEVFDGTLAEAQIYAGATLLQTIPLSDTSFEGELAVPEIPAGTPYLRVELVGTRKNQLAATNPFWLAD
ncbi:MAG: hypothetical protein IJJ33_13205 [Victivallales bacterium]|nr:hypothetical protein [Victivallales bacterium]